jgi:hypothetical protein
MAFGATRLYRNRITSNVYLVVVISQFYIPTASLRGHYGVDLPAFHGGGRPQVPLRARS